MSRLLVDPVPVGADEVEFEAVIGEIGVLLLEEGDGVTPVLKGGLPERELEVLTPVLRDGDQGL